jgi:glycosyltransferase involved in cell wall biosynthesis
LHLIIVGDGALRQEVETLIRATGLNKQVSLLGARSKETIRLMFQASDIFVLPSCYEGMPLALMEALACGIPVVAARVGEVGSVLIDGENGVLTSARTPEAYAAAIVAALGAAERMRGAPCIRSIDRFSAASILPRIYDQYRRLARGLHATYRLR